MASKKPLALTLPLSLFTIHYSLFTSASRAVSSVVEHLVYTERVGGSKPSPPSLRSQRGGERRLSRCSFGEGGPFSPCNSARPISSSDFRLPIADFLRQDRRGLNFKFESSSDEH